MLGLIFLYMLYLYYLFNTHPIRRAEARHYWCRRYHRVQVQGKLSRREKHPLVMERDVPTHAGTFMYRGPVLYRTLLMQVQARWRAQASHMQCISGWEYLYRRTHYRDWPSASGWPSAHGVVRGTPLEEAFAGRILSLM